VTRPGPRTVAGRFGRARGPGDAVPLPHAYRGAIAVAGLAVVLVAGCGGSGDEPAGGGSTPADSRASASRTDVQQSSQSAGGQGSKAPHNPADLRFASAVVALGSRAVVAAGVANASSASPLVRALAGELRRAQGRLVSASAARLEAWGQGSSSGGGKPSLVTPPGSVGSDDVRRLRHSAGGTFGRLWLQLMARQERAELGVARAELRHGTSPVVRALARSVIARSRVDGARMRGLLGDQGD
jgi:uncharacterized protein (DUF305 family)